MEAKMSVGQFVFMLHSHLPYYRKAGMWPFGEENLYECMAETYVPLLNAISELYEEGIKLSEHKIKTSSGSLSSAKVCGMNP